MGLCSLLRRVKLALSCCLPFAAALSPLGASTVTACLRAHRVRRVADAEQRLAPEFFTSVSPWLASRIIREAMVRRREDSLSESSEGDSLAATSCQHDWNSRCRLRQGFWIRDLTVGLREGHGQCLCNKRPAFTDCRFHLAWITLLNSLSHIDGSATQVSRPSAPNKSADDGRTMRLMRQGSESNRTKISRRYRRANLRQLKSGYPPVNVGIRQSRRSDIRNRSLYSWRRISSRPTRNRSMICSSVMWS